MSSWKSIPGLSDSNIYGASQELPNKAPSTTARWADYLCPPSQRSSRSGEAGTFVAVRRFSRAYRGTGSTSANREAP